jgi:hypothetical protein
MANAESGGVIEIQGEASNTSAAAVTLLRIPALELGDYVLTPLLGSISPDGLMDFEIKPKG